MEIDWENLCGFANEYDWAEAFGEGGNADPAPVTRDQVAEVLGVHADNGEGSQDPYCGQCSVWLAFRATDGRFYYLTAWCDTTGWDCRSGADWESADDLDTLVSLMGDHARTLFGFAGPTGSRVMPGPKVV